MAHLKVVAKGMDENDGEVYNIWYFNTADPPADVVSALVTTVYTPLMACTHQDYSLSFMDVYTWTGPSNGEWYETYTDPEGKTKKRAKALPPWGVGVPYSVGEGLAGAITSVKLPAQCAAYIYAKTAVPRDISKKFFGSIPAAQQGAGIVGPDLLLVLGAIATAWKNGIGSKPTEVWGPIHGFQNITSTAVPTYMGTQRRRKHGVGG